MISSEKMKENIFGFVFCFMNNDADTGHQKLYFVKFGKDF